MSESAKPLRVLFCIGINQNFFDLPSKRIGDVLTAFTEMTNALAGLPGVRVLGTMDDDQHMVGPSAQWPWTCYILAEVADQPTVAAACGLFRSTPVGEHALWRYAKIEARIGRPLGFPDEVGAAAERAELS